MECAEDHLARLRVGLLSDAVDTRTKLGILKRLVELKADDRVPSILREAARAPVNESILSYVVRSLGYMDQPEVLGDLAAFMRHSRRSVVANALKAAVALDRAKALSMALEAIATAPLETVAVICAVLAERCPVETTPALVKLAGSPTARDRLAALLFFRNLPPEDASGTVVDMLRSELDLDLVDEEARLLAGMLARSQAGPIEQLRQELSRKLRRVDELLTQLPERIEPSGIVPDLRADLQEMSLDQAEATPSDGDGLGRTPVAASVETKLPPDPLEPPPGPAEAGEAERALPPPEPERKPAGHESAAPAATVIAGLEREQRPGQLLPWQEKERKARERRICRDPTEIIHQGMLRTSRSWHLLAGVAVVLCLYAANHWTRRPHEARPVSARQPVDVTTGPLGSVGAKVKFSGQILEVHKDYGILIIKTGQGVLVSAFFTDSVAGFTAGKQAVAEGVLKEIKTPQACVVQGSQVQEL